MNPRKGSRPYYYLHYAKGFGKKSHLYQKVVCALFCTSSHLILNITTIPQPPIPTKYSCDNSLNYLSYEVSFVFFTQVLVEILIMEIFEKCPNIQIDKL